mmetsp:Transcript_12692/g.28513  ORF Transcript_12692/g.28513 Transcript_12692/m.28513 type:complete len:411 (-) Transcript_12692:50-1282(-)
MAAPPPPPMALPQAPPPPPVALPLAPQPAAHLPAAPLYAGDTNPPPLGVGEVVKRASVVAMPTDTVVKRPSVVSVPTDTVVKRPSVVAVPTDTAPTGERRVSVARVSVTSVGTASTGERRTSVAMEPASSTGSVAPGNAVSPAMSLQGPPSVAQEAPPPPTTTLPPYPSPSATADFGIGSGNPLYSYNSWQSTQSVQWQNAPTTWQGPQNTYQQAWGSGPPGTVHLNINLTPNGPQGGWQSWQPQAPPSATMPACTQPRPAEQLAGWLAKRGANFNQDFVMKWCVLRADTLYFSKDERSNPESTVALEAGMVVQAFNSSSASAEGKAMYRKHPHGFEIYASPKRVFFLDAGSPDKQALWIRKMTEVIQMVRTYGPAGGAAGPPSATYGPAPGGYMGPPPGSQYMGGKGAW